MAKISELLDLAPEAVDGSETVPVVKGGVMRRVLASALFQPFIARAQAWAEGTLPGGAGTKSAKEWAQSIAARIEDVVDRSGMLLAFYDSNDNVLAHFDIDDGRLILGVGGDIASRVAAVELLGAPFAADRSGVLFSVEDNNGWLPFWIDDDTGECYAGGIPIAATLAGLQTQIGTLSAGAGSVPIFPSDDIVCWGDSLTAPGSSGDWPSKLASLTGRQVYNGGIGGQGGRQIAARANGTPVRFAAFTIPADTSSVAVTPTAWTPCSAGGSPIALTVLGVAGFLTRAANGSHTFARAVAGTGTVPVPAGTIGLCTDAVTNRGRIPIIGLGRNSVLASSADPMTVPQQIAAIRSILGYQDSRVPRGIVWTIPPIATETNGTANRNALNAQNAAFAAAFPAEWLDLAAWLRTTAPTTLAAGIVVNDPFTVLGIAPTSQDLTDIANGVTPSSLTSDGLHFRQNCGDAVSYRFAFEFRLRGWSN